MRQITHDEAIKFNLSRVWEKWDDDQIVRFQLFQNRLAIPFGRFHEAIESVLGRPVWTHEFAYRDNLIDEYQKERPAPTFEEIVALVPADKLIIVGDDSAEL